MAKWIHAFRQTTTYLGFVVIAIIWGGIYLLSSEQRQLAHEDALRQGNNLTRVLEEYIRRVVQESDNALLALRQDYERNPQNFDLAAWVASGACGIGVGGALYMAGDMPQQVRERAIALRSVWWGAAHPHRMKD